MPLLFQHIAEVMNRKKAETRVALRGWVHRHRAGKDVVFFVLRDSTGFVQCAVKKDNPQFTEADKLGVESCITLTGTVKEDQRAPGGYEVSVEKFEVVGPSEKYPITKDFSDEFLLDVRHLSVRGQKFINIWKIRSTVFGAIHEYFRKNGYYETHAPFFTHASESGLDLFEVDYFGEKVRLAQTWQFYAEAMLPALEKIYTIAPSFRAEKSKTARHLTEYWHTEAEAAWMDLDGLAKTCEELVSHICQKVAKENAKELAELGRDPKEMEKIEPPFPRVTYDDALKLLKRDGMNVQWGKDLRTPEEKQLTTHYDKPVIVTNYPKEVMAFYKPRDPKNPKTALCLDVLVPEIGTEIIGGSVRDLDVEELKKSLKEKGEDPKNYEWYFDLRRYGSVPHAGFGMGTDRLVQWICKLESIKDAIPFPRTVERNRP